MYLLESERTSEKKKEDGKRGYAECGEKDREGIRRTNRKDEDV